MALRIQNRSVILHPKYFIRKGVGPERDDQSQGIQEIAYHDEVLTTVLLEVDMQLFSRRDCYPCSCDETYSVGSTLLGMWSLALVGSSSRLQCHSSTSVLW